MIENLFELIADVNGKPIPRWQERLEGMYTDYVPFGEILSLVRTLIDESAIDAILKMSDEDVLASFPGDANKHAEEMRHKFNVVARLSKDNANLRRALALAEDEQRRLMAENAELRHALDTAVGKSLAEHAARVARDTLLDAIAMTTTDEAVRTTIRHAYEEKAE